MCITYASFDILSKIDGVSIDLCCFDEAHRVVGNKIQDTVFKDSLYHKGVFFTATPVNKNNIVMYNPEEPETQMCGNCVYTYSYMDGLKDDHLQPLEIRTNFSTQQSNESQYESIARTILTTGNNWGLTFHDGVNGEDEQEVKNFLHEALFKECFQRIVKEEFPHLQGKYTKITMKGLTSDTISTKRSGILQNLKECPDNHIYTDF